MRLNFLRLSVGSWRNWRVVGARPRGWRDGRELFFWLAKGVRTRRSRASLVPLRIRLVSGAGVSPNVGAMASTMSPGRARRDKSAMTRLPR